MLFQTCTKLTFGLSDVLVVTVIAGNWINGVGSLFFRDRFLKFGENMPQSLKRFLSNFNFNSAHASLNRVEGGLLPDDCLHLVRKKRQLIWDHIKGPLVAAFSSPLVKAPDRSVETLGPWIVTSSVTFIKSVNQSSIKPCLIVHLVAVWTSIYFKFL